MPLLTAAEHRGEDKAAIEWVCTGLALAVLVLACRIFSLL